MYQINKSCLHIYISFFEFSSLHKNGTPNQYFHIPLEKPITSFVHDMFLTEKYAIVIDGSLRSDGSRFLFGKGITFFDGAKPMRFGVLPRSGPSLESIKWITLDSPGHVWHTISAWDNPDGVSTFTLRLICRRYIVF